MKINIQKLKKFFTSKWTFNKLNIVFGWIVFFIALLTYYITLEPTTSFWDCGEYIATAYKIQVGHPPGAPLYLILGNFFSNLGFGTNNVAFMINLMSAICSAFTIIFLFWSITILIKKNFKNQLENLRSKYLIILSATIGSLVYTFSDSFWFSAVEGEVYAMSSLFTALVFWSILKWEDNYNSPRSSKWLVFISFLIGLSIGVHMLNLLAIPAITIIYCYKKNWLNNITHKIKGVIRFIVFNILGISLLGLIYWVLIPQIVNLSGKIEIYFVNSLGLFLNSGTIFFFFLIGLIIIGGIVFSQKLKLVKLNTLILSFLFFLIGYSLFFVLIIRSNANTPIDENNPEDAVSLLAYLNREQYGSKPLFWGEYFNTDTVLDEKTYQPKSTDGQPVYTRGYLITKENQTIECFSEDCKNNYPLHEGFKHEKKYLISDSRKNLNIVHESKSGEKYSCACGLVEGIKYKGDNNVKILDKELLEAYGYIKFSGDEFNPQQMCASCNTKLRNLKKERDLITTGFFPRMWSAQRGGQHVDPSWLNPRDNRPGYLKWAQISNCNECIKITNRIERAECEETCYDKNKPRAITFSENLSFFWNYQVKHMYVRYFMWNFAGKQNDIQSHASPILHGGIINGNWLTGLNFLDNNRLGPQSNLPDHIKNHKGRNTYYLLPFLLGLIGLLFHLFKQKRDFWAIFLLFFFTGLAIVIELNQTPLQPRERDYAYVGSFYAFSIWIAFGTLALLNFANWIKNKINLKNLIIQKGLLCIITMFLIGIPTLMAIENWDDHDRSNRYTARDFAKNYLKSCEDNAILFNMGDNDTFPLWYVQEVEGENTDIRTVNLSLLNTDWYINQMRKDAYDGKGVPFSMDPHLYRQGGGGRDVAYKMDIPSREYFSSKEDYEKAKEITNKYGNKKWSLSDFNNWIKSEESYTKIKYPVGCENNCTELKYFPNDKIIIPVNKNIFKEKLESTIIEDEIIISINAGNLSKANLMILDMLEQNNWERPIYFATTIGTPSSSNPDFLFLHEYLQLDGLVYKLTPIKNKTGANGVFLPRINSDILYNNIMSFAWGGLDSKYDIYLDETNLRMIRNLKNVFTQLSTKLIEEKNYKKAKSVIEESFEKIPPKKIALQDYDCTKYSEKESSLIENYFKIIQIEKEDSIKNKDYKKIINYTNQILSRYSSEIKYYSSFSENYTSNLNLQSLLYTATNTIHEICQMRLNYNTPKEMIINEKNRSINIDIRQSLKQMESLASNGILQEALPIIIDTYYYNNYYDGSYRSDSILSKWINTSIPNVIKEELLQLVFQHKHNNKDEILDSLFRVNFNILKNQIENVKKESFNTKNINELYEKIQMLFDMGTHGGLCYTIVEDPYKIYSSAKHTLIKIEFERFYNDIVMWIEEKQKYLMDNLPQISKDSNSECHCLMQFYQNLMGESEINEDCIIQLSSLGELFLYASTEIDLSLAEKKYTDLMGECPMYLENFTAYLMQQQQMTANPQ